jgi:hypothetical protein
MQAARGHTVHRTRQESGMLNEWFPSISRWHNHFRRTRPRLWHLQTAYVVPISQFLTLVAIIAGFSIPARANNVTPIEPGFFLFLTFCAVITLVWLVNLLRPLTWQQMGTMRTNLPLTVAVLHGAALLAPAFVYGVILEQRIGGIGKLSDAQFRFALLEGYRSASLNVNLVSFGAEAHNVHITTKQQTSDNNIIEEINKTNTLNHDDIIQYIYKISAEEYKSIYIPKHDDRLSSSARIKDTSLNMYIFEEKAYSDYLNTYTDIYRNNKNNDINMNDYIACAIFNEFIAKILIGDRTDLVDNIFVDPKTKRDNNEFLYGIKDFKVQNGEKIQNLVEDIKSKEMEYLLNNYNLNIYKISSSAIDESNENVYFKKFDETGYKCTVNLGKAYLYVQDISKLIGPTAYYRILFEQFAIKYSSEYVTNPAKMPQMVEEQTINDRLSRLAQTKSDIISHKEAVGNLERIIYAAKGEHEDILSSFPWWPRWRWFGSNWMFFISAMILTISVLIQSISRHTDNEELKNGIWIALIFAITVTALISYDYSNNIANTLATIIIFTSIFALIIIGMYQIFSEKSTLRGRSFFISVGLSIPFFSIFLISLLSENCIIVDDKWACFEQPEDLRLHILAVGFAVMLILGELYLLLLQRVVIKPR